MDRTTLLRAALKDREGVRLAILFGSEARGTAGAHSDVDVAVLGGSLDRLQLASELSAVLGREVQVVDIEDPSIPLLEELVRDGTMLAEATPGIFAQWRSHALATLETDRPWYKRMQDSWLRRVAERGLF